MNRQGTVFVADAHDLHNKLRGLGIELTESASNFIYVMAVKTFGCDFSTGNLGECRVVDTPVLLMISKSSTTLSVPRLLLPLFPSITAADVAMEETKTSAAVAKFASLEHMLGSVRDAISPGAVVHVPRVFRNPSQLRQFLVDVCMSSPADMTEERVIRLFICLLDKFKHTWITSSLPALIVNMNAEVIMFFSTSKSAVPLSIRRSTLEVDTDFRMDDPTMLKKAAAGMQMFQSMSSQTVAR